GPRAEIDQRLARVHGDPNLNPALLTDPVPDGKPGSHRALGIVFVCERRSKERHHSVSDELLHRASETLELGTQTLVIRTQDRLHVLWIELPGPRGEPHQIGKQHRHDLALTARIPHATSLRRHDRSWTARIRDTPGTGLQSAFQPS